MNNILRAVKKTHITAELGLNKFDMQETWKTLNNILGRNKQTILPDFLKIQVATKLLIQMRLLIILTTFTNVVLN